MYTIQTKQLIKGAANCGVWITLPDAFSTADKAIARAVFLVSATHSLNIRVLRRDTVIYNGRIEGET